MQGSKSKSSLLVKISASIWIFCIIAVVAVMGVATNGFTGTVQDTSFGNSELFLPLLMGFFILGVLAFGLLVLSLVVKAILGKKVIRLKKTPKGIFTFILKLAGLLALFPFFLLYNVSGLKDLHKKIKKKGFSLRLFKPIGIKPVIGRLVAIVSISVVFIPIWIGGYILAGTLIGSQLGYITEPISVSGTGSMNPTFPKGHGKTPKELAKEIVDFPGMLPYPNGIVLFEKRLFGHELQRGDIVVVEDEKIRKLNEELCGEPSGWVKRIVGLPGDTIELREGIVYLNSEPLEEPYTAKPRSTFGEGFLKECRRVKVPDDSIFVMGDNRKGSGDSREVGFIEISSVNHVLPLSKQKGALDKNWRDTSKDFAESSKIKLDKQRYLELLNERRKEVGVSPLQYETKLEESAFKRGEIILEYDDFSYEATRSGYTQLRAMNDVGYSNITYGEAPNLGYYEAEELIEMQFEFPDTKKFLLEANYDDVGIAEVEGELNGCPTQVVVQHFAGYVPPSYNKEYIEGWKANLSRLKEIQPRWQALTEYGDYYQKNKEDVDRINEIISIRIANISAIVSRMEANQWLTAAEQKMADQDQALYDEQESIAERLNSQ